MKSYISNFRSHIDDINSYLLIAFAFFLPLTVAGGNFFAVLIFLFWLIKADFKNDYEKLKNNSVVIAVILFLLLHIVGLLWTSDISWGLHMLKKEVKFLWFPVFMLFVKKEHIKYYIYAFLSAMTLSEIISYSIWFDIVPAFGNASILNPTPFMSHITYNPFLAFTIYILLYYIIFDNLLDKKQKIIYSFFVLTMSINMFITGGRAGQVMYFMMIIILVFQYFDRQMFKAMLVSLIVVPTIVFIAYNSSNIFYDRANMAISNIINYDDDKNTSVGHRLTYAINSWDIIKQNPIIGVGTGDFKSEYEKINSINTPDMKPTENPHNMYTLELVQFGLLGLASLLFILFAQIKFAFNSKNKLVHKVGLGLPLLFMLIMLSDTYLLGHYTTLLFILFSAILYKDYENEKSTI